MKTLELREDNKNSMINNAAYLVLRNRGIQVTKSLNRLMSNWMSKKLNSEEYDGKGRRSISFLTECDVRKTFADKETLKFQLEVLGFEEKDIEYLISKRLDMLKEGLRIYRQSVRGAMEDDLRYGIRPWQVSMREKIDRLYNPKTGVLCVGQ